MKGVSTGGWCFPLRISATDGALSLSTGDENVRQSLVLILGTRPGERQMCPEFGCRVHELLFSASNRATAHLAARFVEEAVHRWEPRVDVLAVEADLAAAGTLRLELHYRVRRSGTTGLLVHDLGVERPD